MNVVILSIMKSPFSKHRRGKLSNIRPYYCRFDIFLAAEFFRHSVIPFTRGLRVSVWKTRLVVFRPPSTLLSRIAVGGCHMLHTFRFALCLLALSLSLNIPALAQSQSSANSSASSEANNLVAALARAGSEEEQERLLVERKGVSNGAILAALKAQANPLMQKGD
jgi:hypothetical protein